MSPDEMTLIDSNVKNNLDLYSQHAESCIVAVLTGQQEVAEYHAAMAQEAYLIAAGARATLMSSMPSRADLDALLTLPDPDDTAPPSAA